jgi:hypothetical protein
LAGATCAPGFPRRQLDPGVALDGRDVALLARLVEGDRPPAAPHPAGPPDAVDVDVGRGRDVEVDDVGDPRDVQPAGGHVGGHEQRQAAALEGDHHAVAGALAHVAVQRLDVDATVAQPLVELLAADLRAHEDDGLVGLLGIDHPLQRLVLVAPARLERELLDRVDGERRRLDLHRDRLQQIALGQPADLGGHRRAEQRRLARAGA